MHTIRTIIIAICAVTANVTVTAQGSSGFKRLIYKADSLLERRYSNTKTDTAYVTKPKTSWTLRTQMNTYGSSIEAEGVRNGEQTFKSELHADYKTTLSFGAGYKGLSLSVSINPKSLVGKSTDYEFNLTSYGNRIGFELAFQRAKTFEGWFDDGTQKVDIPQGHVKQNTVLFNGYYALNHRRFSYPAAFTQSYMQRISQGSWLLGLSAQTLGLTVSEQEDDDFKLRVTEIGIGGGYAYNFVLRHNWMLHISSLPTFIVYSNKRHWVNGESQKTSYKFPEVILTGRGAAIHTFGRYFIGATMVFNFSNISVNDGLRLSNRKWQMHAFLGMRL